MFYIKFKIDIDISMYSFNPMEITSFQISQISRQICLSL